MRRSLTFQSGHFHHKLGAGCPGGAVGKESVTYYLTPALGSPVWRCAVPGSTVQRGGGWGGVLEGSGQTM